MIRSKMGLGLLEVAVVYLFLSWPALLVREGYLSSTHTQHQTRMIMQPPFHLLNTNIPCIFDVFAIETVLYGGQETRRGGLGDQETG
jgi:hypothetical protein